MKKNKRILHSTDHVWVDVPSRAHHRMKKKRLELNRLLLPSPQQIRSFSIFAAALPQGYMPQ